MLASQCPLVPDDPHVSQPWQEREDRGYLRAFVETVRAVLRSPRAFFAETSGRYGLAGPLLFGVVAGVLGEVLQFVVVVPLSAALARLLHLPTIEAPALTIGGLDLFALPSWALSFLGCQGVLLAVPLLFVLYAAFFFAFGGLTHLALRLTGGLRSSSEGFAGTFAVICFATAVFPAQMIPALGDAVFTVLLVVVQSIGLSVVHKSTRARALVAILMAACLLVAIAALALRLAAGPASG